MSINDMEPKVSVCIVTYNHEHFIRQCLQSLVEQQTDFKFEVIVGDDCSTDGTRAIVQEFADRYPGLVRAMLHPANLGPTRNYLSVHQAARGKYVAQLDGDDFALPGKLQAQADCLDGNPDVSFCVHAVTLVGTNQRPKSDAKYPEYGSMEDLLRYGTYFVASSVCYRREYEQAHPELWSHDAPEVVDYYFHLERASKGKVYFDRRPLGCYRVHPQGMSRHP
ncbi:MAG: hypothetical protein JWM30_2515, partial [Burkholderia sp.]|nr:hypothetical protein [Burkholderia sp.]